MKRKINSIFIVKQPAAATSTGTLNPEEEKMRIIVAKKEQELLMLQRKKVEMEQTRRQLQLAEKTILVSLNFINFLSEHQEK